MDKNPALLEEHIAECFCDFGTGKGAAHTGGCPTPHFHPGFEEDLQAAGYAPRRGQTWVCILRCLAGALGNIYTILFSRKTTDSQRKSLTGLGDLVFAQTRMQTFLRSLLKDLQTSQLPTGETAHTCHTVRLPSHSIKALRNRNNLHLITSQLSPLKQKCLHNLPPESWPAGPIQPHWTWVYGDRWSIRGSRSCGWPTPAAQTDRPSGREKWAWLTRASAGAPTLLKTQISPFTVGLGTPWPL